MKKNCYDIGTIQAFLDGELAFEQSESVARHVAACDDCACQLAEAEEESALAFSVLEQEFNTLVPTQRLWTKINDSIGREKKPIWKNAFAFLLQPSTVAFASLLFVAAVFVALVSLKPDAPTNYIAQSKENRQIETAASSENQQTPILQTQQDLPAGKDAKNVNYNQTNNGVRAIKTNFVRDEIKVPNVERNPRPTTGSGQPTTDKSDKPLAGEESYIKTIATLTDTVKNRKDEVLNSSSRFAFERDLAVTDDAIKKMREEVKKNPNNEAAKQILRASYQNKIDLLNSVAEKNELMASLK